MQNFAALTLPELAPILGILAGMLIGFYALLKFVLGQAEKTAEADRAERKELAKAIKDMADPEVNGNKAIAEGITRQADESAQRNGHLGTLILEQGKQSQVIADTAVKAVIKGVQNVQTQNVIKQNVNTSTVKDETIEHETINNKE